MRPRQMAGMGIAVAWGMAGAVSSAWAQGSLTPPGAPAPAMRTLTQMEPRIPIESASYMITQPGSYYLTTNLACTRHGIVIQSSRVTLDLMGFSLTGDGDTGEYGVWVNGTTDAALRDIVVRGGTVSGFGDGVRFDCAQNSRMEGLTISSNSHDGAYLGSVGGVCDGNTIANCAIGGNAAFGVRLDGGDGGECDGNTVRDCTIVSNAAYGVRLIGNSGGECDGNTVRGCTIIGNGTSGVCLSGTSGECDGNTVVHCIMRKNRDSGILASAASGNRIENNHVSGTTGTPSYGIWTGDCNANLILQNSCVGQTINYFISANDTCGPIVTNSGTLATNGAAAHPWANFSR